MTNNGKKSAASRIAHAAIKAANRAMTAKRCPLARRQIAIAAKNVKKMGKCTRRDGYTDWASPCGRRTEQLMHSRVRFEFECGGRTV